jgi:hypothetical protein
MSCCAPDEAWEACLVDQKHVEQTLKGLAVMRKLGIP